MNIVILQELARKWRNQAELTRGMPTDDDAVNIAKAETRGRTQIECANELQQLINLFYPSAGLEQVTLRGARMQLMKEFMEKSIDCMTGEYMWEAFCHVNPEHADWFDDDGIPK